MKLVEFTRDFLPQRAGETRVVPDALAERLIGAGEAVARDSVFDRAQSPDASAKAGYRTKKQARLI
jgi:hypothetical protein